MFQKLITLLLGVTAVFSRCNPFYRKDYTYVEQFDAFYKLHWDLAGQSWSSAFMACDDEGSALFYPKTTDEWTIVKGLVAPLKVKPNVTEIFVGIHDELSLGEFVTVDGLSTPTPLPDKEPIADAQNACVVMDIDTGTYKLDACAVTDNIKPFVCKKVEDAVPYCPTIDRGYSYEEEANKCYKISQRKKTWTDAMKTCFMEGGTLVVIKNPSEDNAVNRKITQARRRGHEMENYFVGFRRLVPNGDFYTVKGQQYDNSFYRSWRNDGNDDKDYDCGVFITTASYANTRDCLQPALFLCEMAART